MIFPALSTSRVVLGVVSERGRKKPSTTGVLAWVLEGLVFEGPMCNILIIYPVGRALGIPTSIHRVSNKHGEIVRLCHYGASYYIKTIIELYVLRVPIIKPMWFNLLPLFNLNVVSRNTPRWETFKEWAVKLYVQNRYILKAKEWVMAYDPFYFFSCSFFMFSFTFLLN